MSPSDVLPQSDLVFSSPDHRLCVCADDFAASESVSQAIAELLALGRIHATSVMACSPRWPSDAQVLRPHAAQASVGLHLDWTSPFAVAAGHGMSLPVLMARCALRALSHRQASDVIERQLDAFESVWENPPSHVDGHQHIHQFAVIRDALFEVLDRRYGIEATLQPGAWPWLRNAQVALPDGARMAERFKASVIDAWGAKPFVQRVQQAGQSLKGPLLGVYDFNPAPGVFEAHMAQWLHHFDGLTSAVLMVHPALRAEGDDPIGQARVREWAFLSGPQWPQLAARHGVDCG